MAVPDMSHWDASREAAILLAHLDSLGRSIRLTKLNVPTLTPAQQRDAVAWCLYDGSVVLGADRTLRLST